MAFHRPIRRIWAARSEERDDIIARRAAGLRPFLGGSGAERASALRRLLRAERRACGAGTGYDAARHATLCRLLAEVEGKAPMAERMTNEKGRHDP